MRSLVTSIFLYACESWTLTEELQRRIQAMEMRCYRKILYISYKDHVTNKEVCAKIQQAIRPHKDLLTIIKRHKLQWCGQNHLARHSEREKKTRQTEEEVGRQHQVMDTPGVHKVSDGNGEQGKMEETGCEIICGAQTTFTLKEQMRMMMMKVFVFYVGLMIFGFLCLFFFSSFFFCLFFFLLVAFVLMTT